MEGITGRLIIITGMSGAGKSTALRCFEDLGFCCIDNLPPSLITTFLQLYSQVPQSNDIVIVCDVRSGELFSGFREAVDQLSEQGLDPEVVFLDCEDEQLVARFKEKRRMPPMSAGQRLEDAVARERRLMDPVKERATTVIDTSHYSPAQLTDRLLGMYSRLEGGPAMQVTVLSFGFKYGMPADADFTFDSRFLPNPFYEEELRNLTGNDREVRDFVLACEAAPVYVDQVLSLLGTALPNYRKVHKHTAVVAFGCTGGKHRSVTLANVTGERLAAQGYRVVTQHRDVEKV